MAMRRKRRLFDRYRGAVVWADETTVVGPRFTFAGEIDSEGAVVVAGRVEGPVESADVVHVMAGAVVLGSVRGKAIVVDGAVEGHVHAVEAIELGHTGRVRGDLSAGRVAIAEGAYHLGHVHGLTGPVLHFRERRKTRRGER